MQDSKQLKSPPVDLPEDSDSEHTTASSSPTNSRMQFTTVHANVPGAMGRKRGLVSLPISNRGAVRSVLSGAIQQHHTPSSIPEEP